MVKCRSAKAFTLIELLVAMTILSILAAITIPRFVQARYRAYLAACLVNERNLATALESYRVDYKGYPPIITALLPPVTGFISALPTCPSGPNLVYLYETSPDHQTYTISCPGFHEHQIAGQADKFPQYSAQGGLQENQ